MGPEKEYGICRLHTLIGAGISFDSQHLALANVLPSSLVRPNNAALFVSHVYGISGIVFYGIEPMGSELSHSSSNSSINKS